MADSAGRSAANLKDQPGFKAVTLACLIILYAPIAVLTIFSFNASDLLTKFDGFSLHWYRQAFRNPDFHAAAGNTLIIAVSATIIATVLGTAAALGTTRSPRPWRGQVTASTVINLPLAVPEIVLAVANLAFFALLANWLGLSFGSGNVILAHAVLCTPFAYMPIRARLEGMDMSLEHAASDLYATPWQAFRHVTLPLLGPGILSGAALAFIVSFDDFTISQFVVGPGQTTLPLYIWGMIRKPITPEVNAMCSILLAISVLFILASYFVARKRR